MQAQLTILVPPRSIPLDMLETENSVLVQCMAKWNSEAKTISSYGEQSEV